MQILKRKTELCTYISAFFVSLFYFLFHFHFMQRYLDYDQIVYLNNIMKTLKLGWLPLYNPHHLHFEIGGQLFHQWMIEHLGSAGFTDWVFNIRLRSLIFACLGLFFVVPALKNLTGKLTWGIIGALMIGFAHGYVHYATKIDTGIFPAVGLIMVIWVLSVMQDAKRGILVWALVAGILLGLNILFHQTTAIGCIAAIIAIMLPPFVFSSRILQDGFTIEIDQPKPQLDYSPVKRYATACITATIGLILTIAAYFYTGVTEYNLPFDKPHKETKIKYFRALTFQKWLFLYMAGRSNLGWGQGFSKFNPKSVIYGYTSSFLAPTNKKYFYLRKNYPFYYNLTSDRDENSNRMPIVFTHNQIAYFSLFLLIGLLVMLPAMWKRYGRTFLFILLTGGAFIMLAVYWEPYYFEFWIVPNMFLIVIAVLILNLLGERIAGLLNLKKGAQILGYAYGLFIFILMGLHNFIYFTVPFSRNFQIHGIPEWARGNDYYKQFISTQVYLDPKDPYKCIYKQKSTKK